MSRVAILGTGMSGFGAAHRLRAEGVDHVLYDKNSFHGGHTVTLKYPGGWNFDIGPHVSFTDDPRIQDLFAEAVAGEYETHNYKFLNYWQGTWVKHPAQTNLHGLPVDVVTKVITDFVARKQPEGGIRNYEDWLRSTYGEAFADWFPGRYTLKYHTTEARNLTTDWMGPRMYAPSLEEVLVGALAPAAPNVHYIKTFRYPKHGGFESYLANWALRSPLELGHEVVSIDCRAKSLEFADGSGASWDALVSSIPLPELVKLVRGVPPDVLEAAGRLACSSCVLVNVGVSRSDLGEEQIRYFYDLDVVFPRISYPHRMSERNAPEGCGSIQVEIYFSKQYRPFSGDPKDWIEPAVRDLVRTGVLREDDELLLKDAVFVKYANIIFDHSRTEAVRTVRGWLEDAGIHTCGRYGEWAYFWTDDSFKSREAAADRAMGRLN